MRTSSVGTGGMGSGRVSGCGVVLVEVKSVLHLVDGGLIAIGVACSRHAE